ncbi:nucleotidyltransferase domain-containing protein [Bacteroides fragilis]|jgi:hypothetical protein|nr:nucleotidyltransferase domain-containing protein [Bacteroides fragilis]
MNHLFLLHEIVEYLHFQFPRASIGISGSIANNTFKESSDIDLLFVNETILNAYSISFYYKGISVSIFVFSLNFLSQNYNRILYGFHNMPSIFILQSNIIYDSTKIISVMKRYVFDILQQRKILRHLLIEELKKGISNRLETTNSNALYKKKKSLYWVCKKMIDIFFLQNYPDKVTTKKEGREPFILLKEYSPNLFLLMSDILPYKENSLDLFFKESLIKKIKEV